MIFELLSIDNYGQWYTYTYLHAIIIIHNNY